MSATRSAAATHQRISLPGGTLVVAHPSHAVPLVTLAISLRSGGVHDPEGKDGLMRTTLRMLRRGAGELVSRQIDDLLDRLGAEISADVSAITATLYAQVVRRNLEPFLQLLETLLRAPTFPEDELGRLTREIVAEIIEVRDNDRALAQRAFRRTLFAGHPYARSAAGNIKTVPTFTRADVQAHFAKHFTKGNLVIGFAGDIGVEQARVVAERLAACVADGPAIVDTTPEPVAPTARKLVFVDKPERTQTQIVIGSLGTWPHDPDHHALSVANSVFGGTFTSRLMREVRSKRGWSYGASARLSIDRRRHAFSMVTFPAATDCAPCIELQLQLFEELLRDGITAKELSFIKRYLVRSYAFEIDTAAKRMHQAMDVELLDLPEDYYTGYVGHVEAVTLEQANAALRARLPPDGLLTVVVGTAAEIAEQVAAKIPRLAEQVVVPFDAD